MGSKYLVALETVYHMRSRIFSYFRSDMVNETLFFQTIQISVHVKDTYQLKLYAAQQFAGAPLSWRAFWRMPHLISSWAGSIQQLPCACMLSYVAQIIIHLEYRRKVGSRRAEIATVENGCNKYIYCLRLTVKLYLPKYM